MSARCGHCASMESQLRVVREQLLEERRKRTVLEHGADNIRGFGEHELTTDEPAVRPRARLARVLVARLSSLLDIVRS